MKILLANVVRCDHCGKPFDFEKGFQSSLDFIDIKDEIIDLCPDCKEKLKNIIKNFCHVVSDE